ncbi:MFS transporter [Burkholderia gladioli]|uniref:MFS transporter n=1 Tax=Burkholderia gladioli TaxID=28095 RepID=UPI001640B549|nr:MFS transporter [Burkholderia gladioli]
MSTVSRVGLDARASSLYAKVNLRLLPFLLLCYLFAYLDRVNVGFAKLQMQQDLALSDAAYGVGAGIFFIGYVLFEVPSNLLLPRIGARRTFSRILCLWGITSACMLFVRNVPMFYAMRFLLGVFEAGFAPGMIWYLSRWYGPSRMGRAIAIVFLAGPIGGIVGGPLSAALISTLDGRLGLAGWQWMFLVEGLPCVLLGLLTLRVLPDRAADARWLDAEEKQRIEAEIAAPHLHERGFGRALRDLAIYRLAIAYFSLIAAIYAISFWLPTLLKARGATNLITLGWYSAIPYLAAAIGMTWIGRRSDRTGERRYHAVVPACAAALALAAATRFDAQLPIALALLTLATAALWMAYTVFWAIPSNFIKGAEAAGVIALINTIGLSGGFWGPAMIGWVKTATGSLDAGLLALAGFPLLAAVLLATNRLSAAPR